MEEYPRNIGIAFHEIAERFPDRPAVSYEGEHLTYAGLVQRVDRLAETYIKKELTKGEHVLLFMKNRPEVLVSLLALWTVGAVPVPVNGNTDRKDVAGLMELTDTRLIADSMSFSVKPGSLSLHSAEGRTDSQDIALLRDERMRSVNGKDLDTILFTSGTTYRPRAVCSTHFARIKNAIDTASCNRITYEDRFLVALPMNHCFCLTASVLSALLSGACICFAKDHHSANILKTIEEEHCTIMHGVPTMFLSLVNRLVGESHDVSSLRMGMIGGAGYTPAQFRTIRDTLGIELLPSLGQTEATAGITCAQWDDSEEVKAKTVGRCFPDIVAEIRDPETNERMPEGTLGELCIRGYNVMTGYYRSDSSKILEPDGLLHTGDLASIDGEGNITVKGRKKEIIIRGGENIAPMEIELVAASAMDAAGTGIRFKAIGVPDSHFGEEICLCVMRGEACNENDRVLEERLRGTLSDSLPHFKQPKYYAFFDAFPLNANSKTDMPGLRTQAYNALFPGNDE